jgi:hypothetical protein
MDVYQNRDQFLYKYAGSFLEEAKALPDNTLKILGYLNSCSLTAS